MTLAGFDSQPYVTAALRNAIKHGRLAHAYLFVGPDGIGKREVALRLAQALNCEHRQAGDGCGTCRSCERIRAGNHPDVRMFEPERASIRIDDVRDSIIRDISYRPFEGRYRVYIICRAERLTTEAANSLLKVLEEPPDYVVIVMLTSNLQALLPTIRSRVQRLAFHEVPKDVLVPRLQEEYELPADRAAFYAGLARGNPGEAGRLIGSDTLLEDREQALNLLGELIEAPDDMVAFDKARELSERGREVGEFLELLIVLLRDTELLLAGSDADRLVNRDIVSELSGLAGRLVPGRAAQVLELVQETLRALDYHANNLLACEVFLLKARRSLRGTAEGAQLHLVEAFGNS